MIGGALWFTEPVDTSAPVEEAVSVQAAIDESESPEVEVITDQDELVATSSTPPEGTPTERRVELEAGPSPASSVTSDRSSAAATEEAPMTENVEVVPVPENWESLPAERAAAFGVDVSAACVGTEIGFRMARPMKEVRVLWNFGDGQFSSDAAPHHTFKAPGTYDITLSVTRISDGLIRTRTIENLVTIHPRPEADFTWEVPATAASLPTISLRDRSRDAASATWVVDGESTLAGDAVSFDLPRVGHHTIQLVASSPEGCQSVASHDVEVGSRFGLGASARFSPDGDGRYDTFFPRKLMNDDLSFVFRVEDKTGHIVHETTEVQPWDGHLPEGGRAKAGERFQWTAIVQGEVGPSYFSDELIVE